MGKASCREYERIVHLGSFIQDRDVEQGQHLCILPLSRVSVPLSLSCTCAFVSRRHCRKIGLLIKDSGAARYRSSDVRYCSHRDDIDSELYLDTIHLPTLAYLTPPYHEQSKQQHETRQAGARYPIHPPLRLITKIPSPIHCPCQRTLTLRPFDDEAYSNAFLMLSPPLHEFPDFNMIAELLVGFHNAFRLRQG